MIAPKHTADLTGGHELKTVYLMRHAKSDWNADYSGDFNRPLNARGRKACGYVGSYLANQISEPDVVLCSSAQRTRETCSRLEEAAGWTLSVQFEDDLYLASPDYVFNLISALPDEVDTVLVIGHQPTTGIVASTYLGGKPIDVPTAAFIEICFGTDSWGSVHPGKGELKRHILARNLELG